MKTRKVSAALVDEQEQSAESDSDKLDRTHSLTGLSFSTKGQHESVTWGKGAVIEGRFNDEPLRQPNEWLDD